MNKTRILLSLIFVFILISSNKFQGTTIISQSNVVQNQTSDTVVFATPYTMNQYSFFPASDYITKLWTGAVSASLVKRSAANNENWVPDLTTSLPTISPDYLQYTFTLKNNLNFSNGLPITVNDIYFSLNVSLNSQINPGTYLSYSNYMTPSSFTVLSANSFVITLTQVHSYSLDLFNFPIIPESNYSSQYNACIQGNSAACAWNTNDGSDAISAGPYMVKSIDTVYNIINLTRNPFYYNAQFENITNLVFKYIPTKIEALSQLKTGSVDILDAQYQPLPSDFDSSSGLSEVYTPIPFYQEIALNHKNPYFGTGFGIPGNQLLDPTVLADNITAQADAKIVRKAMSLIIDRNLYTQTYSDGLAQPAATVVNPTVIGFDPSITPDPYNLTMARQLMSSVGFDYSALGTTDVNGAYSKYFFNITVLSPNTNPARNQMASNYASQLAKIGIGVTQFVSTGWAEIVPRTFGSAVNPPSYNNGGYDILFVGLSASAFDYVGGNNYNAAGSCATGDCTNFYNFDLQENLSPIANDIRSINNDFSMSSRLQKIHDLQLALDDWMPTIPLVFTTSHWMFRDNLGGINFPLLGFGPIEWGQIFRSPTPIVTITPTPTATPPVIQGLTQQTVTGDTSGVVFSYTLYSEYPNQYQVYFDGGLKYDGNYTNGQLINVALDGLNTGTHTIRITASDTLGQTSELDVTVTVYESTSISTSPTVTTSSPSSTQTTTPSVPLPLNLNMIFAPLFILSSFTIRKRGKRKKQFFDS